MKTQSVPAEANFTVFPQKSQQKSQLTEHARIPYQRPQSDAGMPGNLTGQLPPAADL